MYDDILDINHLNQNWNLHGEAHSECMLSAVNIPHDRIIDSTCCLQIKGGLVLSQEILIFNASNIAF